MSGSLLRGSCALLVVASLTACSGKGGDPMRQYGPNPYLPEPRQYLIPPMSVPKAVGWKSGETPSVPGGLRIQAMATGLMHPRIVYPLPNGDVLVVESNSPGTKPFRPKDYVQGKVKARAGAGAKGGNRITLLRDADGDGVPELRTVLVDHLHSPYGIALVGGTLYVANTDAIIAFPFTPGQTKIAAPGVRLTDLPAGPIDHHWTKAMVANPDGSKLYVGVGSNSNITENGMDAEQGRAAIYEVDRLTGAKRIYATGTRNPTNLAIQPGTGQLFAVVNERDEIGPDLVPDYLSSIKDGGFYGWPYSYWGPHVDVRVHPQDPTLVAKAIKPDYGLKLSRGGSRARIQRRTVAFATVRRRRIRGRARKLGSKPLKRLPSDLRAIREWTSHGSANPRRNRLPGSRSQDGSWPAGGDFTRSDRRAACC